MSKRTSYVMVVFGVLVILNAAQIALAIGVFKVITFVLAGLYIIYYAYQEGKESDTKGT